MTWESLYAYLAWPVIFVGQTYRNHYGILSLGTWASLQCTSGLVGHGLCVKLVSEGVGPVMQTVIAHPKGFCFNQPVDRNRTMSDIMNAFAAQVTSGRFAERTMPSPDVYEALHNHIAPIVAKRNEHGPFVYGPLEAEEPRMVSSWRHELLSSRWQKLGRLGFTNDPEWAPMESGWRLCTSFEGEVPVYPAYIGAIVSTGKQALAFLTTQDVRRTILLLKSDDDALNRAIAYFRCPGFMPVNMAIKIVWEGEYRLMGAVSKCNIHIVRSTLGTAPRAAHQEF